jgi:hypothetical protein
MRRRLQFTTENEACSSLMQTMRYLLLFTVEHEAPPTLGYEKRIYGSLVSVLVRENFLIVRE